eukprot:TRINITY_DN823_c0_g2_i4.p1 TRINITY_DN823_c0_g2~~TRINITY_DN823_c0_g2_i4.p1  ORF type:complete len:997 (+),score=222.44 TRINITY_DN823_c0_g2_i4:234-3224(+)
MFMSRPSATTSLLNQAEKERGASGGTSRGPVPHQGAMVEATITGFNVFTETPPRARKGASSPTGDKMTPNTMGRPHGRSFDDGRLASNVGGMVVEEEQSHISYVLTVCGSAGMGESGGDGAQVTSGKGDSKASPVRAPLGAVGGAKIAAPLVRSQSVASSVRPPVATGRGGGGVGGGGVGGAGHSPVRVMPVGKPAGRGQPSPVRSAQPQAKPEGISRTQSTTAVRPPAPGVNIASPTRTGSTAPESPSAWAKGRGGSPVLNTSQQHHSGTIGVASASSVGAAVRNYNTNYNNSNNNSTSAAGRGSPTSGSGVGGNKAVVSGGAPKPISPTAGSESSPRRYNARRAPRSVWNVFRTSGEFAALRLELKRELPHVFLPAIAPANREYLKQPGQAERVKSVMAFVNQRRLVLDRWFQEILANEQVKKSKALWQFLNRDKLDVISKEKAPPTSATREAPVPWTKADNSHNGQTKRDFEIAHRKQPAIGGEPQIGGQRDPPRVEVRDLFPENYSIPSVTASAPAVPVGRKKPPPRAKADDDNSDDEADGGLSFIRGTTYLLKKYHSMMEGGDEEEGENADKKKDDVASEGASASGSGSVVSGSGNESAKSSGEKIEFGDEEWESIRFDVVLENKMLTRASDKRRVPSCQVSSPPVRPRARAVSRPDTQEDSPSGDKQWALERKALPHTPPREVHSDFSQRYTVAHNDLSQSPRTDPPSPYTPRSTTTTTTTTTTTAKGRETESEKDEGAGDDDNADDEDNYGTTIIRDIPPKRRPGLDRIGFPEGEERLHTHQHTTHNNSNNNKTNNSSNNSKGKDSEGEGDDDDDDDEAYGTTIIRDEPAKQRKPLPYKMGHPEGEQQHSSSGDGDGDGRHGNGDHDNHDANSNDDNSDDDGYEGEGTMIVRATRSGTTNTTHHAFGEPEAGGESPSGAAGGAEDEAEQPAFNIASLYREPEQWEQNIVALDRGEWIPGMDDAAFKRYKFKERPRLPSLYVRPKTNTLS